MVVNETHDPNLACWLPAANQSNVDFPIQNLPFSIFKSRNTNQPWRSGVAIGDQIIDLLALASHTPFADAAKVALEAAAESTLNKFMTLGNNHWSALRLALSKSLREQSPQQSVIEQCLLPQSQAEFNLPCRIGDYTDFYTSIYHATAVGKQFRPDNPLLPNYKWVPIGYHGRASSIAVSGQAFHRPHGQLKPPDVDQPKVGPCKRLDYELEIGIFIGEGNALGQAIPITQAENHVFGLCLLNDWSARDIQAWEYQPLGPFLSKSFATTISPWIVTIEALAPFRCQFSRPPDDPPPLPYLQSSKNSEAGGINLEMAVWLQTKDNSPPTKLSQSNYQHAYWTMAQLVSHHTINGCNLQAGDLFGSGTQSGPSPEEAGSLLELSKGGKEPVTLANGETRTFLEDGDTVIFRAWCENADDKFRRIGFGAASGTVLPAVSL